MTAADRARKLTLVATALGSSLAFIDTTVVIVALPAIDRDLGLGLAGEQWVYLSYSLALAALYLVSGGVGDRFGRRETFVGGVVAFAAASALCGLAPNEGLLIAGRFLQGIGGAVMTTNSLALLRECYGREAGRAIGLWTSFTSIAIVIGPPAGGALVDWVSWRWIFFLNLPLAVVVVLLARAGRVEGARQERVGRLDLVGSVLSGVGFAATTYALVEGGERGLDDVWWAALLALAALAGFVAWERRTPAPLLPLDLFRRRNFSAANLTTFLVYAGLGGTLLYVPLYLQFLGFSAFEAGLALVPTSVVLAVSAARFGALADEHGPRLFLSLGPALLGAGVLLLALIDERGDLRSSGVAGLALFAVGLSMVVAPITTTAIASAPERLAGIASGVNQTVARVGGLVAVALMGLVISVVFRAEVNDPRADPFRRGEHVDATVEAFRAGMLVAAGLVLAGAVVAALWISNEDARAAHPPAEAGAP